MMMNDHHQKSNYGTLPQIKKHDSTSNRIPIYHKQKTTGDYSFEKFVLFPNTSMMIRWDMWLILAIAWTAFFTVYDVLVNDDMVSVLEFNVDWFLLISFITDTTFILDTVFRCFRAYRKTNGQLVTNLKLIRRRYMRSHEFIVDILASIPFDMLLKVIYAISANDSHVLYHLRYLRLLRLLRLARGYRSLIQSYFYEQLELKYHSAKISLAIVCVSLIVINHWFACVFVWIAREETISGQRSTWIDVAFENPKIDFDESTSRQVYMMALYFAVVTTTSVGFGDIVPTQPIEYLLCTILIFIGGATWAFVIGTVSGIVAHLNSEDARHRQALDALNMLFDDMDSNDCGPDESQKHDLRLYLFNLIKSSEYKQAAMEDHFRHLLPDMLKDQISTMRYGRLVKMLPEFRDIQDDALLAKLARMLRVTSYPGGKALRLPVSGVRYLIVNGLMSIDHFSQVVTAESAFGSLIEFPQPEEIEIYTMSFFQLAELHINDVRNIESEELEQLLRRLKHQERLTRWVKSIEVEPSISHP